METKIQHACFGIEKCVPGPQEKKRKNEQTCNDLTASYLCKGQKELITHS